MNNATQTYLNIAQIKKDCLVMKDGALRAVILVSSVNFALKSEDEQKALIQAYASFLNTLDTFPIQIVIQSRPFNIDPYLLELNQRQKEQTNDLLRMQIADYRSFVKELVELGKIMSKKFYLVVPYSPWGDKPKKFWQRLTNLFTAAMTIKLEEKRFNNYREQLFRRVNQISSSLSSMGLKTVPLDTQSLIELFYNCYNPTISANEKLTKISDLRIEKNK